MEKSCSICRSIIGPEQVYYKIRRLKCKLWTGLGFTSVKEIPPKIICSGCEERLFGTERSESKETKYVREEV